MSAATIIYLAEVSSSLITFIIIGLISFSIAMFFLWMQQLSAQDSFYIFKTDSCKENLELITARLKKHLSRYIPCLIIFGSISVFLPSSKTIYLMAGAKVAEDVAKSPEAKEISSKIIKVLNQKLDEQLEQKK